MELVGLTMVVDHLLKVVAIGRIDHREVTFAVRQPDGKQEILLLVGSGNSGKHGIARGDGDVPSIGIEPLHPLAEYLPVGRSIASLGVGNIEVDHLVEQNRLSVVVARMVELTHLDGIVCGFPPARQQTTPHLVAAELSQGALGMIDHEVGFRQSIAEILGVESGKPLAKRLCSHATLCLLYMWGS